MFEKQHQNRVGAYVLKRSRSAATLAPEQLDPYRSGGLGAALLDVEPDAILERRPVKRLVLRLARVAVAQRCAGPRRRPLRRLEQQAPGVLRPRIPGHRRAAALKGDHDDKRRFQDKAGQVHWPSAESARSESGEAPGSPTRFPLPLAGRGRGGGRRVELRRPGMYEAPLQCLVRRHRALRPRPPPRSAFQAESALPARGREGVAALRRCFSLSGSCSAKKPASEEAGRADDDGAVEDRVAPARSSGRRWRATKPPGKVASPISPAKT